MRKPIEFENIEELRRQAGIDDVDLRAAIGKLQPGDLVNLTLAGRQYTLISARITRIQRPEFRARLVRKASRASAKTADAQLVTFAACHIHSVAHARHARPRTRGGAAIDGDNGS